MQKFTGAQYLKIDIANSFGLDKKKWHERIAWFDENEHDLINLIPHADEPAMFYAGIQAWEKHKAGLPSGYPVSLDATSSGLQILSCLTGDREAARLCNVINYVPDSSKEAEAERRDGYTVIYNSMLDQIGERAQIKRDDVKQAIMTSLYGSEAVPKEVFGEGVLLRIFERTMAELAPAAWELNKAFLDMWDPEATMNSWVLPDNFHVHIKVMDTVSERVHFLNKPYDIITKVNQPTQMGRSLGANSIHSIDGMIVREITRRCDFNPVVVEHLRAICEQLEDGAVIMGQILNDADADMVRSLWAHYEASGYLSARILEHLYPHNFSLVDYKVILKLIESLPAKPFKVIAVHDCFRCLPNHANDLREQYNIQLATLAGSTLLGYLVGQLLGDPTITIDKLDHNLSSEIMEAEYALS